MVDYNGVPTIFFSRQWNEALKYSHPLAAWLSAAVTDFDVAHIHAVFSHASVAAARACLRRSVPYLVRPLGSLDPWSLGQKRLRKRLLWHLGASRMLREAAAVHYTTAEERRLAEGSLGLDRGFIIPLGIDEELLGGGSILSDPGVVDSTLTEAPYVLAPSRLHPKKNLELLIDVFLELSRPAEHGSWRLLVAGSGDASYVVQLKRFVADRGGNARVVFTGWLDGPARIAALRHAALLAQPSHQENFGLSVVEALACGIPALVSERVNIAEEIARAGAGWVVPLERAALRETLREALGDEAERRRRGNAGRELVADQFTWAAVGCKLERLYHSTVNRSLSLA
jgi:glycosyltransferase involved in cell wall biosynthesis